MPRACIGFYKRACYRPTPGKASQIHLSWAEDPSATLTITWRTPGAGPATSVQYRRVGESKWDNAIAATRPFPGLGGNLSRITLRKLSPETEYEYRVSNDLGFQPAWSKIARARTGPPWGSGGFTFAFIADTGIIGRPDGLATGTYQIIEEVRADNPLFILGGGDYAYGDCDTRFKTIEEAIDAWFQQMESLLMTSPLMAQYGNHEVSLEERFEDWAARFGQPLNSNNGRDFSFDVGDSHFTGLLIADHPPSRQQLKWLDEDLATARDRGSRWLIVFHHEPIYAHGKSHPAKAKIRQELIPVLQKHRVDLHLSAHDQNYERTFPLIGSSENPTVANRSLNQYKAGNGIIYVKISPGGKLSNIGKEFSKFSSQRSYFIASRDDQAHHYAMLTASREGILMMRVYAVTGDGSAKREIDRFTIHL